MFGLMIINAMTTFRTDWFDINAILEGSRVHFMIHRFGTSVTLRNIQDILTRTMEIHVVLYN